MNLSKKADAAWKVVGFIPISLIGSTEIDTILKNKESRETSEKRIHTGNSKDWFEV
ncbi:MAG: hypothetical protein LKE44_10860 [Eubacterium sp.]|jgi:hypothetical protein|nr:hypothetical protein [Eubacterium sp.]